MSSLLALGGSLLLVLAQAAPALPRPDPTGRITLAHSFALPSNWRPSFGWIWNPSGYSVSFEKTRSRT